MVQIEIYIGLAYFNQYLGAPLELVPQVPGNPLILRLAKWNLAIVKKQNCDKLRSLKVDFAVKIHNSANLKTGSSG